MGAKGELNVLRILKTKFKLTIIQSESNTMANQKTIDRKIDDQASIPRHPT